MSTGTSGRDKRVTTRELISMKARGEKIVVLTAYDFLFAGIVDAAGVDVVLVGDSLGHVVLGFDSTIPVTLEDMIRHGRAVRRAVSRALLVVDMPFMSFHVSSEDTLRNAGRILKETEAESVKLEGGDEEAGRHVRALVRAGIPVMGHIGLTPQSVHALGGYRVQGRDAETADRLLEEALRLQDAGAYSLVLELMPAALAGQISRSLEIPTIGIGAGPQTDGQVLVLPDMLGLNTGFQPKFLRRFGDLGAAARAAIADYAAAVRSGEYPAPEHSFD
jgi:3-methyl-2-oxobutanoate hydroxymethyltransferase